MPHWHEHAREHLSRGDVAAAVLILFEAVINLEQRMSIADQLAADLPKLHETVTAIQTFVGSLQQQITDLKAQVAAGGTITADQVAALESDINGLSGVLPPAAPPADTLPAA